MRRSGGMDNKCLGIANIGQMTCQFQAVDDFAACFCVTLDTEAQDATICVGTEETLSESMGRMGFQTRVFDPCDLGVLFEPSMEENKSSINS